MAEIIAEPTVLSKVIALKFKINDVDVPKTTQLPTNKQFNTTDTDAWFTFELDGLASTGGTYDLTLINLDDESIFHHANVLFQALPFHYKLNSSEDVTLNEIRHAGRWLGQLVVSLSNGDTTARQFGFNIAGHILDGQDAQVVLLSDYQTLINTINLAKDDLAQYNVDYAALIADVTTAEGLREQAEIDRAAVFATLVESEMVAQNVATKLAEKEATFAPRMLSLESELADKAEQSALNVEKARIDSFTTLASGSTTGDAELIDGRVGADGVTYPNVGGAIRGQVSKLSENLIYHGGILEPTKTTASGNFVGGWTKKNVITGLTLEKGKTYYIDFKTTETALGSAYGWLMGGGLEKTISLTGRTSGRIVFSPIQDYTDATIALSSQSFVGKCKVDFYTDQQNEVEKNTESITSIKNGYCYFDGAFVRGYHYAQYVSATDRIVSVEPFVFDYDIIVKAADGFDVLITTFDVSDTYISDTPWVNGDNTVTILANTRFRVCINNYPDTAYSADIELYKKGALFSTKIETRLTDIETELLSQERLMDILAKDKYIYHIGVDDAPPSIFIPSQSVDDIRKAKRMGFSFVELNVRVTSDNVFYCFHGTKQAFGNKFISLDSTDISKTLVSSVTSDYIEMNVRWNTAYDAYKNPPAKLVDALYACKRYNVIPLVEYQPGIVEVLDEIMGVNNYMIGSYNLSRKDIGSDCIMVSWLTGDKTALVKKAKSSGGAFVVGVNTHNASYSSYTDAMWRELTSEIHKNGLLASFAYGSSYYVNKMFKNGFDICATTNCVPYMENPNLFNLHSDFTFTDYSHTGTVANGALHLATNDTAEPKTLLDSIPVGGLEIHLTFSGTIHLDMTSKVNTDITSDGKESVYLSTFANFDIPTFKITALENCVIHNVDFKASRI